jgi:hypothetical protein
MGRFGIMEIILIFIIVAGPILAIIFMAGYQLGKKKALKQLSDVSKNQRRES